MNAYEWALAFKQDANDDLEKGKTTQTKNFFNIIGWGVLGVLGIVKTAQSIYRFGRDHGSHNELRSAVFSIDEDIDWETM